MNDSSKSSLLLLRVANRLRIASIGRRFYLSMLTMCVVYAIVLMLSRFLGVVPDRFSPLTLLVIPVGAGLLGLIFHRRPTPVHAARMIDQHKGTKDLFLTAAMLESSAGQYKPLVLQDAEDKANYVAPSQVVPFRVQNQFFHIALGIAILFLGILYLPQLDPFGKVKAAEEVKQQKKQLVQSKKATEERKAHLISKDNEDSQSKEVKKAVENLKSNFKKMKKPARNENKKRLALNQKELGEQWKVNAKKLNKLLKQSTAGQKFGEMSDKKQQQWIRELQQGSTDSLRKEMDEVSKALEELAKTKDPVKRAEAAQKLKKKLKDLEKFSSDKAGSKPLAAALKRAMQQLEMAKSSDLTREASEALKQSLELAKLELEEVAQSAKDLKTLEDALKALGMAKRLNDSDQLDGEACENCQSLADYEELFAQMMGGLTEGDGDGTGGEGQGKGGQVDEDDSVATDFKQEQSKSAVKAGKVLLSMKTKGLSDSGDAKKNYRNLITQVKQGYSEAIEQEQIPPGYHEGIKKYFDAVNDDLEQGNETNE